LGPIPRQRAHWLTDCDGHGTKGRGGLAFETPSSAPTEDALDHRAAGVHGEKRKNDTHQSTSDPDSRLYRKAAGREAKRSDARSSDLTRAYRRHELYAQGSIWIIRAGAPSAAPARWARGSARGRDLNPRPWDYDSCSTSSVSIGYRHHVARMSYQRGLYRARFVMKPGEWRSLPEHDAAAGRNIPHRAFGFPTSWPIFEN
jgi:hypothetical protein